MEISIKTKFDEMPMKFTIEGDYVCVDDILSELVLPILTAALGDHHRFREIKETLNYTAGG